MFTKVELLDAINELSESKHSIQNCERLAAVYTVLDHLFPEDPENIGFEAKYSMDNGVEKIKEYGQSQFLKAIAGKNPDEIWLLIDDLMTALQVLNPKLYQSFLDKLF